MNKFHAAQQPSKTLFDALKMLFEGVPIGLIRENHTAPYIRSRNISRRLEREEKRLGQEKE